MAQFLSTFYAQALADFEKKFGIAFAQAPVHNVRTLGEKLGLTPLQIDKEWQSNGKHRLKLAPGLYVVKLEARDLYLINGFYGAMRQRFVEPGAKVHTPLGVGPLERRSFKNHTKLLF